jgi:branched-chain amino acid transport system permease protein/neutral amino acid transport system permease protein
VLVINVQNLTSTSGTDFVILVIAAAVLGGVGSPYGAMIGALVIGVVGEVSAAYINPSLNEVSAFALLGLTLLVRPSGLVSRLATVKGVAA